jgi:hypothetical protein
MVKTIEDQMKEDKYWWRCSFCKGRTLNEGTTDVCSVCGGIRKTA